VLYHAVLGFAVHMLLLAHCMYTHISSYPKITRSEEEAPKGFTGLLVAREILLKRALF